MSEPGARPRRRRGAGGRGAGEGSQTGSGEESQAVVAAVVDPRVPDRPTALRLARVHLRLGSLALARAERESLAGRETLDDDGLLDLAEVRWRTGDLAGAGEAADVLIERGREDVLALVIAAEAVAAEGRPGEARRLAGRALAALGGPLDPLFAGMPHGAIWPEEAIAGATRVPAPGEPAAGRREPTEHRVEPPEGAGERHPRGAAAEAGSVLPPASTAAAEAFAGGLAALGGGDVGVAALRLGVALRLDPGFADGVLDAIGDRASEPVLALVAGDALRLLGREIEALAAFHRARGHQSPEVSGPAAPGAGAPSLEGDEAG